MGKLSNETSEYLSETVGTKVCCKVVLKKFGKVTGKHVRQCNILVSFDCYFAKEIIDRNFYFEFYAPVFETNTLNSLNEDLAHPSNLFLFVCHLEYFFWLLG